MCITTAYKIHLMGLIAGLGNIVVIICKMLLYY